MRHVSRCSTPTPRLLRYTIGCIKINRYFCTRMKYALIVPVYNRPDEVGELLESLTTQTMQTFEVVVVEDGSTITCQHVVDAYAQRLPIRYFAKPNSGPGQTRNYGAARTMADYLVILDSDVVLPPNFIEAIEAELTAEPTDAWGGPDRAHPHFSPMQKAINYAMTSFFTTGGIRGGKQKLDKFYPRSFNMGIRREVYAALGGFSPMRFGEDIDFSTRIIRAGYRSRLMPTAWVWHKRRTDLKKFFKQVHCSGMARIDLTLRHPGTLKAVHLLPTAFTIGVLLLLLSALYTPYTLLPLLAFALIIGADATRAERSLHVGVLAIAAAFVQLMGYGSGLLRNWWRRIIRQQPEQAAFQDTFYE